MSSPGAWCFSAFLFFLLTILASHISPQFKVGDVPLCRIEIFSDAYVENYFDSAVVLRVRDCRYVVYVDNKKNRYSVAIRIDYNTICDSCY